MAGFFILILCLNLDALSFGVAYGLKKKRFPLGFVLKLSVFSTILFSIPLYLSKFLFKYFNRTVCNIINGLILIVLGLFYLLKRNKSQTDPSSDIPKKSFVGEAVAFSVDALFTAFLGGFPLNFYIFFVIFYFFTNFLAIFLGNLILFKINKNIKFRLDFVGGIVFLLLGFLKIFGV